MSFIGLMPILKRGIIKSNVYRILGKVNSVIFIMYTNCMPEKGDNAFKYLTEPHQYAKIACANSVLVYLRLAPK